MVAGDASGRFGREPARCIRGRRCAGGSAALQPGGRPSREHLNDALEVQTQREVAINALAGPASAADPRLAAQARTLLGILTFSEASNGGGISQTDAAIADFTDAIRVDPGDTAAKFDLELLLRLECCSGPPAGDRPGQRLWPYRSCRLVGWGVRQRLLMSFLTPWLRSPGWRRCSRSAPRRTAAPELPRWRGGSDWTHRLVGGVGWRIALAATAVVLTRAGGGPARADRPDRRADAR